MSEETDEHVRWSNERWNEETASELLGSFVLVGIEHPEPGADVARNEQIFGYVTRVDRSTGITIRLEGSRAGEEYNLPPDTTNWSRASLGEYKLRTTGEVVADPDFISSWSLTKPAN